MKTRFRGLIIFLSVCILIVVIFTINILATRTYPEPSREGKNIPDNIKWNVDTGEYYNADIYEWNAEQNKYIELSPRYFASTKESISVDDIEKWVEDNKGTDDIIDKALIDYHKAINNNLDASIKKSYYDPFTDKNLYIITDLGFEYIPEMMKRVENKHPYSSILMSAVCRMTKIPLGFGVSNSEREEWKNELQTLNKNISIKSNDIIEILKKSESIDTIEALNNELTSYGLLILPYIMDQVDKGDYDLINYLPMLIDEYSKINKEDLKSKDINYWKQWFSNNRKEVNMLRTIFIQ